MTLAKAMYKDKNNSVKDICATLQVGKTTLYRYLNAGKPAAAAPAAAEATAPVDRPEAPARKVARATKKKGPSQAKGRRSPAAKPRS